MSELEHLGPYQLGQVIGRGGMGTVYHAKHVRSGEEVAVKLIAQHVADDPRFRRRFDAEVETLKRLRHPNIVRLIGYGEEAGRLFYSMELIHGQSLQQRIRDVKRLAWMPAVDIAIQVCAALKHAHDIGVIHRDLKPANLLLTDAGQVKLVDFGIAKLFGFGEQTLSGSVLGTADYMAPEQANSGKITPRTDLYELGSVMYAMLAGRSPFAGKKLTEVIEALKRDRPVPLDLVNPELPEEIVAVIHQLLEKLPEDRPPTALAVMNRLKAIRAGLQREQTVDLQEEPTRLGGGGSDSDDESPSAPSGDTAGTPLTDSAKVIDSEKGTAATDPRGLMGKTVPRPRPPVSGQCDPINPAVSSAGAGTAVTMDSFVGETEPVAASTQTQFQTVEDHERQSHWLGSPTADPASSWVHGLSIAGMILVLIGGAALFWYALRTPSADQLHAQLRQAESNGDLTLQRATIDRFLATYPDDQRVAEVERWRADADLDRMLRRLRTEARAAGGTTQLPPISQSFLRAMDLRETSSDAARAELQAWLDVFAPDPRQLPIGQTRELARLAEQTINRLTAEPSASNTVDPRLADLQQRWAAAEDFDPEQRRRFLAGLIQLYEQAAWARPIVNQARTEVDDLRSELGTAQTDARAAQ